jgi:methyltransferase (TIGR00027 family)
MWHAWLRHTHATAHPSPIYSDTRSVQLVPEHALARVRSVMAGLSQEAADAFILMTVTRCRLFADRLRPAHERGVRQLVILGAGLDVTGLGLPAWADQWRTFEVDTPETQTWKRRQFAAIGWEVPPTLIFAPCDFERQGLRSALAAAGFDARRPAMVSLFGVILYLSTEATRQTLAELVALAPGSELTLSYCSPADQADPVVQELMSKSTPVVDATGERFVGYYLTSEMESLVRAAGFRDVLHHPIEDLSARYLGARPDGLRLRPIERLLTALC